MKSKFLRFTASVIVPTLAILNMGDVGAVTLNGFQEFDRNNNAMGNTNTSVILDNQRVNTNQEYQNFLNSINGNSENAESFENFAEGTPIDGLQLTLFDPSTNSNYTATFRYVNRATGQPVQASNVSYNTTIQRSNDQGLTIHGTYPTEGRQGFSIYSENDLIIEFSQPISSFSFFGTDIGEFNNTLSIEIYNDGTQVGSQNIEVPSTSKDSGLFFTGFSYEADVNDTVGSVNAFDEIRFVSSYNGTGSRTDAIGLDEFTFAANNQASTAVPEPLTILGSMAALGFGALLKKKLSVTE